MPRKKTSDSRARKRLRHPTTLRECRVTVVGLDGIGRGIATMLASLGIRQLQLIDGREVARRSQAADGFAREDVGRFRVHVTAQMCHQINPQLDVVAVPRWSLSGIDVGDIMFGCSLSPRVLRSLAKRSALKAICHVVGEQIHLDFRREGDAPSVGISGTADRLVVPAHIAAVAAGLAASEFIRFAATDRPHQTVVFDLQTLQSEVSA